MAFIRISKSSTTTSVLLILVLALCVSVQVAVADDNLIRKTCHNAEVPETCIKCVKSDSRSDQADVIVLAKIVVDCVISHADILHGNMSALASEVKNHTTKKILEDCSSMFSYAKNDLIAATLGLRRGDYDAANRAVYTAVLYRVSCGERMNEIKEGTVEVPQTVLFELAIYEELTEAAMRIINRLE